MRKKSLFIVPESGEDSPPKYFRPCGVIDEFLDDPLEELLAEFSDRETDHMSPILPQTEINLNELIAEVEKEMPILSVLSPVEQLRLSMVKLKKKRDELSYYIDEINLYIDE